MEVKFEPLLRLRADDVKNFYNRGVKYLVGQTYSRRFALTNDTHNVPILFTPYKDLLSARVHFIKLQGDMFACIADMGVKKHINQVLKTLNPGSGYEPFYAVPTQDPDTLHQAANVIKKKALEWIAFNMHLHVNPNEFLRVTFSIHHGNILVSAKVNFKSFTIPLSEVEPQSYEMGY